MLRYYKNVRKEWASLVSTPPTAKFQDALAFTRSLGDFHLHTYGIQTLNDMLYFFKLFCVLLFKLFLFFTNKYLVDVFSGSSGD